MPSKFLLDENLQGDSFYSVLEAAGIYVVRCRDEGFEGTEDAIWIPAAAQLGYVIVSGDQRQRYRAWEKEALVRSGARVLHVVMGKHVTHPELAQNFVNTYEAIERFIKRTKPPFVATIVRPHLEADLQAGKPGRILRKQLPSAV